MSGRNRGPHLPMKGSGPPPPVHEPRGMGPRPPHPAMLEEMRDPQFRMGRPRPFPPHPAIIEEHLTGQLEDIQGLLGDNQRLAATHVALKQELEAAQHELQWMAHYYSESLRAEKDGQMREMYESSVRLEVDLRGVEAMRAHLVKVRGDIKQLSAVKQDLTSQFQVMNQDLARRTADAHKVPALKVENQNMKQELQRARSAMEYEKKGYAENYEHGQVMEKKLISMAREVEKLRAEIANVEKRAASAGYNANYGNPAGYGMAPVSFPPAQGRITIETWRGLGPP